MKKYQIALAGTFDVENYGDLMFPLIFEKSMKKRGMELELTLFSPTEASSMPMSEEGPVFAFKDFERLNDEKKFDALVVGGGALIHYKDFEVAMPNKAGYETYYNINSWLPFIYLAAKNGMKILFNLPQVPFEILGEFEELTKATLEQVDYVSVRDDLSKRTLEEIYDGSSAPEIRVYPDSVMIINELYDKDDLAKRRRDKLGLEDEYMVLHFQSKDGLSEEEFESNKAIMEDALKRGLKVVLLPIGYTYRDDEVLRKFNERVGGKCITFDEKLDVLDITAVLAGCRYYVGYSFHGAVVTMAYGGRAFSMNPSLKNQELFRLCKMKKCLDTDARELLKVIEQTLAGEYDAQYPAEEISRLVNEHFDNVYEHIVSKSAGRKESEWMLLEMLLSLSQYEEVLSRPLEINALRQELNKARKMITVRDAKIDELKKDIDTINKSTAFKIGRKITYLPHKLKGAMVKSSKV